MELSYSERYTNTTADTILLVDRPHYCDTLEAINSWSLKKQLTPLLAGSDIRPQGITTA